MVNNTNWGSLWNVKNPELSNPQTFKTVRGFVQEPILSFSSNRSNPSQKLSPKDPIYLGNFVFTPVDTTPKGAPFQDAIEFYKENLETLYRLKDSGDPKNEEAYNELVKPYKGIINSWCRCSEDNIILDFYTNHKNFYISYYFDEKTGKDEHYLYYEYEGEEYYVNISEDGKLTLTNDDDSDQIEILKFNSIEDASRHKPAAHYFTTKGFTVATVSYFSSPDGKNYKIATPTSPIADEKEIALRNHNNTRDSIYFKLNNNQLSRAYNGYTNVTYEYDKNGNLTEIRARDYHREINSNEPWNDKTTVVKINPQTKNATIGYHYDVPTRAGYDVKFEPQATFNKNGKEIYRKAGNYLDGKISGYPLQENGNCYFYAQLNAIRQLKNGDDIINNLIKRNSDGSFTVTFPGASPYYPTNYTFTKDEIIKLRGQYPSYCDKNDLDFILLSEAWLKLRKNEGKSSKSGGSLNEVFEMIFPKFDKSQIGFVHINNPKIFDDKKYYDNALPKSKLTLTQLKQKYKDDFQKSGVIYSLERLKRVQISGERNTAGTWSYQTTDAYHAVAIKKVTDTEVIVIDSNDNKEKRVPIDIFVEYTSELQLVTLPPNVPKNSNNFIRDEVQDYIQSDPKKDFPQNFDTENEVPFYLRKPEE